MTAKMVVAQLNTLLTSIIVVQDVHKTDHCSVQEKGKGEGVGVQSIITGFRSILRPIIFPDDGYMNREEYWIAILLNSFPRIRAVSSLWLYLHPKILYILIGRTILSAPASRF